LDILLALLYAIVFCWIISKSKFFKLNNIAPKYLLAVFVIKILAGSFLFLVYTYYYEDRSTADIFKYFDDSKIMFDALSEKPMDFIKMLFGIQNDNAYFDANYYTKMNNWYRVFETEMYNDTHTIIRLNAIFRLFSFGSYHVHTVFMCFLSLLASVFLFRFFSKIINGKEKLIFIAVFLLPSVLLWTSAVLKEGLLLFGMGIMLYYLLLLLEKKKMLFSFLMMAVGFFILLYIKYYTLAALLIPLLAFVSVRMFKINRIVLTYTLFLLVAFSFIAILSNISEEYNVFRLLSIKQQDFIGLATSMDAGSLLNAPILESTPWSFLKNIPYALFVVFFRPFFFESLNPLMILAGLENLIILLLCVIAFFFKVKKIQEKNLFFFSLAFVFILYVLIGVTTPVMGAIVRYKVPAMIFLLILVVILLDDNRLKKYISNRKILVKKNR
jgi:hypothetical protein